MNVALYSIAQVCEMTRMDQLSANPEQWLVREIKKGRFRARRIGRQWAMTATDIELMLNQLTTNTTTQAVDSDEQPQQVGLPSIASMRRRRSA